MSIEGRRYRTRRNQIAVYPFSLLIGLSGLLLAGASGSPIAARLVGIGFLLIVWPYTRWGLRIGVDVADGEIIVRGPYKSQRLFRDDIMDMGTYRWFANKVVYFDLRDGRRLRTNLIQGALVTWQGGGTKDILSVLRHELGTGVTERRA